METGTVISADGEKGTVSVKMERSFACEKCGKCKSFGANTMLIEAENTSGAQPGDTVTVTIEESVYFKALLWLYGIPFAALIFGFVVGMRAAELIGLYGYEALVGFGAGILLLNIAYLAVKRFGVGRGAEHRAVVQSVDSSACENIQMDIKPTASNTSPCPE